MKLELNQQSISVKKLPVKLGTQRDFFDYLHKIDLFKISIRMNHQKHWPNQNFYTMHSHHQRRATTPNLVAIGSLNPEKWVDISSVKIMSTPSSWVSHSCHAFYMTYFRTFHHHRWYFLKTRWKRVEFWSTNSNFKAFCQFVRKISTSE